MNGERIFQLSAVILAGVAAFFMWQGNFDLTFAAAVLGAVCFFLSIRFQIRGRMMLRELETPAEEPYDDEEDIPE